MSVNPTLLKFRALPTRLVMVKGKVLIPPDNGLKAFVSAGATTCPLKGVDTKFPLEKEPAGSQEEVQAGIVPLAVLINGPPAKGAVTVKVRVPDCPARMVGNAAITLGGGGVTVHGVGEQAGGGTEEKLKPAGRLSATVKPLTETLSLFVAVMVTRSGWPTPTYWFISFVMATSWQNGKSTLAWPKAFG